MKEQSAGKKSISSLAVLLLMGIFAVCILSVLAYGTVVYRKTVERDHRSEESRIAIQYVATKIRQASAPDQITVESFEGASCLCFRETIEGFDFVTRIYCYDGALRELFTMESVSFQPGDGEKVTDAEQADFVMEDGLIKASVRTASGATSVRIPIGHGGDAK